MINVEEVVKKSLKEKLDSLEIEEINKSFSDQEKRTVSLFSEHFSNHISTETAKCVLENVDLLHPDIQFIVKYEIYKIISFYHFAGKQNLDIFSLLLNKKDFYNKIYYVIEEFPANSIINFINNFCSYTQEKDVNQEYLNCLVKLSSSTAENKAYQVLNALSNEIKFDLFLRASDGVNYLAVWQKIDHYLNPKNINPFYYNYLLTVQFDNLEILNKLLKMNLLMFNGSSFKHFIINNHSKCQLLINKIYNKSVEEKFPELIFHFSTVFPEKKILKSLLEIGNKAWIQKFINERKDSKSIKELLIYY